MRPTAIVERQQTRELIIKSLHKVINSLVDSAQLLQASVGCTFEDVYGAYVPCIYLYAR